MDSTTARWLVAGSAATFVLSLALLPAVVVWIPADYFVRDLRRPVSPLARHPVLRLSFLVAKNVAGGLLFLAGVLMLFTPGQGILGMLAGLWLMDFPGKRKLERRLVGRPAVLRSLNALRARFGRPPLESPRDDVG
jgi:hypothetical protein